MKTGPFKPADRFLSVFKGLLNGCDLAVSVLVDFLFRELLFDRHTNPDGKRTFQFTAGLRLWVKVGWVGVGSGEEGGPQGGLQERDLASRKTAIAQPSKTWRAAVLERFYLLHLGLLIGDPIAVELGGDVFCLPHPWHHFGMLLGSGQKQRGKWLEYPQGSGSAW